MAAINNSEGYDPCPPPLEVSSGEDYIPINLYIDYLESPVQGVQYMLCSDQGEALAISDTNEKGIVTFGLKRNQSYLIKQSKPYGDHPKDDCLYPAVCHETGEVIFTECESSAYRVRLYRPHVYLTVMPNFVRNNESPVTFEIDTEDEEIQIGRASLFAASPYLFVGYATCSDFSGNYYYPGELLTITSNMFLYSIWKSYPVYDIVPLSPGDKIISGKGVANSRVFLQIGLETYETDVDQNGNWRIEVKALKPEAKGIVWETTDSVLKSDPVTFNVT